MPSHAILLEGHIIDSLMLPKLLDLIEAGGGTHEIEEIEIGRTRQQPSRALIRVFAPDEFALEAILANAEQHGAARAGK